MVILDILQSLSWSGGKKLLLEEGYLEEECIEQKDILYDKLFLYPYCLYDAQGKRIDCIYWAEFCNHIIDDEYTDGRMTWEAMEVRWIRL